MHRGLILLFIVLSVSGLAAAEPPDGKTEITVHSGWSFLNAEIRTNPCPICAIPIDLTSTTTLRGSMMFGFKGGYYINRTMEVEGGFAVAPGHQVERRGIFICTSGFPCPAIAIFPTTVADTNAVSYQYEGNFVYNLNAGGVSPFMTFGVGGVSTALSGSTRSNFAFNYGGGAKFYFGNLGLRLEVNDHVIPNYFLNDKTEHDLQVQYGFVFRLQ